MTRAFWEPRKLKRKEEVYTLTCGQVSWRSLELQLCLGLMLLLSWGATQDQAFSNNSKREEEWPKLEIVKHLPLSCDPKILKSNIYSVSVNTLNPSDVKFVASIGIKETLILLNSVGMMEKQNRTEETSQDICLGMGKVLSDIIRLFNSTVLTPICLLRREMSSWTDADFLWTQATELVRSMKENEKLDFKNDWKIINLFLSNTHECYLCPAVGQSSFVKSAMNKLTKTLDYLQQEVPRSFVNLVDLTDLLDFIALPGMKTQHSNNTKFCKCSEDRVPYKAYARMNYQELWESVLSSSKYNQKESFAVVFQPFFYDPDLSHLLEDQQLKDPSSLGVHLWNLMMEPAGQKVKPYSLRYRRLLACPPKGHPYLFTYKNSNFQPRFPPANQLFQPNDVRLKCSDMNPSWTIPNSVHQLKPADIKVVAAVGDSVLAAAGAEHRLQTFNSSLSDHHSLTWRSNAGNETLTNVLTLPNILRKFNSELIGYTLGHGMKYSAGARLNQAVSRDISIEPLNFTGNEGLPSYVNLERTGSKERKKSANQKESRLDMSNQVTEVIRKMKNDKKINYKDDWKLLTMFIGGQELCYFCIEKFNITPEILQNGIQHALDILQGEVPRMVVNVVSPLEITSLNAIYKETENICPRDQLMKLCPCVMKFNEGAQEFDQVVNFNKKYQRLVEDLIYSGHYDKRHDFTVVLQPFLERFEMPRTEEGLPDLTYFDPDCFHFSQKTLGHIASALWNSMLQPVGQKSRMHNFTGNIVFACPTQGHPYLMTSKNSVSEDVIQCPDMSPSTNIPISVDKVKPADIKIVAALGGYLNAGRGAGSTSFSDLSNLLEFRGVAFSIGGDKELPSVKTLPNILRKFNSDIKGYSVLITKTYEDNEAWLNLATPQALTQQFRDQCERLVNRMKAMSGINYAQDWKLITVMIGYQDFCVFCDKRESYSTDKYVQYIKEGLDYLHNNVPKALVNILYFIDPMLRRQMFLTQPKTCIFSRSICPCVLNPPKGSTDMVNLENLTIYYKIELTNLIWSGRYDTSSDFTVVLQPFLEMIINPAFKDGKSDTSYFSFDCLSISQKGHGKLAYALWNNMLEDLGNKTRVFDFSVENSLMCPGMHQSASFLKTKKNSGYKYPTKIVDQDWGSDFDCMYLEVSPHPPSSASKLQPADIQVVAAMGDWVTSAWGASPFTYDIPKAWKSVSWSTGGHKVLEKQTTLPNILLKFSSVIHGISRGSWPELAGLNVAEEEARVQDMPEQANKLLQLMEFNSDIDMDNDWKLITIFIGINDLCDYCKDQDPKVKEKFIRYMNQTLHIFYTRLPKVFINLVEVMDVTSFYPELGEHCVKTPLNCPCFHGMGDELKEELLKINMHFQDVAYKIPFSVDFSSREDFMVVTQPFFRKSTLLHKNDSSSYLSLNCQYFSSLMQNQMAIALWNNMLEPVGYKTTSLDLSHSRNKLKCPTKEQPYFSTLKSPSEKWIIWVLTILICIVLFLLVILITIRICRELRSRPTN